MNRPPASDRMRPPVPVSPTGWLTPQPWRLEDEPPGAELVTHQANSSDAPLLLLIEQHRPLAEARTQQLAACLSSGERQRLSAYRLSADRQRFLLGRAGLRRLLGTWLQLAPEAVRLENGPHSKPHCPGGPQFNLSHSGDLILLALHPSRPLGVDVELLRPELDWQPLARRLFSEAEQGALACCPPTERPGAFLASWCRLEARLKARGTGLAGLERLRQQERRADVEPWPGDGDSSGRPEREPAAGGEAPTGGSSPDDQQPKGATAACERVWNVQVPEGYRAAVALAPGSD